VPTLGQAHKEAFLNRSPLVRFGSFTSLAHAVLSGSTASCCTPLPSGWLLAIGNALTALARLGRTSSAFDRLAMEGTSPPSYAVTASLRSSAFYCILIPPSSSPIELSFLGRCKCHSVENVTCCPSVDGEIICCSKLFELVGISGLAYWYRHLPCNTFENRSAGVEQTVSRGKV